MKASWKEETLGEVVEVLDRLRKPITKKDRESGEVPYYGATGVVDWVKDSIFDEPLVLVGEDGAKWSRGDRTAFQIVGPSWVNNHAHVLKPKRDVLDDRFLTLWLEHSDLTPFITGVTVPKLNQRNLRQVTLPLPPLDEQNRIVAVLDEAFAALDEVEEEVSKLVRTARTYCHQVTQRMLEDAAAGAPTVGLSDVVTLAKGQVDPTLSPYRDMPHIGAGNMEEASGRLLEYSTAAEDGVKSGKYHFESGAVLYSKIRPYLRKAVRPGFEGVCSADVYPVYADTRKLRPEYLKMLLLSDDFTAYAEAGSARAGMPKVNRKHFLDYELALPDTNVQDEIASKSHGIRKAMDTVVETFETQRADVANLRQSLLQRAFAGELVD